MSYYQQFVNGWVPETVDLEGDWIVRGLLGPLPMVGTLPFRVLGHLKQFTQITQGLYEGNNRFLDRLNAGFYEASLGESKIDPGLEVINIEYAQKRNPWVMRGLTDEVRFVEENKMLGRGVYQPEGFDKLAPRSIFWFTVTKEE